MVFGEYEISWHLSIYTTSDTISHSVNEICIWYLMADGCCDTNRNMKCYIEFDKACNVIY